MNITAQGTRFRLQAGPVALAIDAAHGARICEFSRAGHDVLLSRAVHADNYGSTFWTSPQADWGWPPPAAIDAAPYAAAREDGVLVLRGPRCERLGVAIEKRFAIAAGGVVAIEYVLHNAGDGTLSLAPWEVSRVARRGLSFFPLGAGVMSRPGFDALAAERSCGALWIDHGACAQAEAKLYADGAEGWLAHAVDGRLFIKSFPDIAADEAAPGEAEIELYVSADPAYAELEQQGRYLRLSAGATQRWRLQWRLVDLPAGLAAVPGESLLAYARQCLVL